MSAIDGDGDQPFEEAPDRMHEGLLELDGELESRYLTALKSIGLKPAEGYSSLRDYVREVVPSAMHIDRTGYSPEVASVFGENYLSGRIIILTEEQCTSSSSINVLPREDSGLAHIVESAGTAFRSLMLSVLPKEALIVRRYTALAGKGGSYNLSGLLDQLAQGEAPRYQLVGKSVVVHDQYVRATAPSRAMQKARFCQETLLALDEQSIDDYLLGDKRENMDRCGSAMKSLGKMRYDENDLHRMSSARFEVQERLEEPFRFRAYHEDADDLIIDIVPAREAFIVHASGTNVFGKDCPWPVVSIADTDQLMSRLFEAGYLDLDYDAIDCALFDVGLTTLAKVADSTELIGTCTNNIVKLFHELARDDVMVHLPDEWFTLRDLYVTYQRGEKKSLEELNELYSTLSESSKLAISLPTEHVLGDDTLSWLMGQWIPQFLEEE